MNIVRLVRILILSVVLAAPVAAQADDWKLTQIDGDVRVAIHGQWQALQTGDIVSDDAAIRTSARGSALFTRDHEKIVIAPNTQIRILDRVGQRYTIVQQYFGTVGVEANVENVRHFEVRTPYLAAVVKGTVFGVHSDANGAEVSVERGTVGVQSVRGGASVDVHISQSGVVGASGALRVAATAASGDAAAAAATAAAAAWRGVTTRVSVSVAASAGDTASSAAERVVKDVDATKKEMTRADGWGGGTGEHEDGSNRAGIGHGFGGGGNAGAGSGAGNGDGSGNGNGNSNDNGNRNGNGNGSGNGNGNGKGNGNSGRRGR